MKVACTHLSRVGSLAAPDSFLFVGFVLVFLKHENKPVWGSGLAHPLKTVETTDLCLVTRVKEQCGQSWREVMTLRM